MSTAPDLQALLDDGFAPASCDVLVIGCGNILRADDAVGLAERVTAGLQSLWPLAVTTTVALAARRPR